MNLERIVVIGASAGGLEAVTKLISKFPENTATAVFIVLHLSKHSMGDVIVHHLQKNTSLACGIPKSNDTIQAGHVYVAPPDHHMLVKKDKILINSGPQENRWRPSIDVLFRSAAVAFTSNVIGIVLSGLMDDGTSGMWAIKQSGGLCMVQEPSEAEFADMPNNVLNNVDVDYQVPIADMEYILGDLLAKPGTSVAAEAPPAVKMEAEMTERMTSSIDMLKQIGSQSLFTCPDCGGGLWEINHDKIHRYRCHTGHVYTEKVLLQVQSESIEESIWVSVRMLEERRNLLLTVADHENKHGNIASESDYKHRAAEMNTHIERLKSVLQSFSVNEPND